MSHDANWHEHQYNPRVTVANAASVVPGWRRRALATREKFPPLGDIKYGPHRRENYDLFRVPNARGTVVYIHGGYWRMLSKLETSWIAEGFVQQGLNVALINYPLCPDVTVADIRQSCIRAFVHLWTHTLEPAERERIAVTGHSAGGHLAALHLATDWLQLGLVENPIMGVLPVSGIFDVEPLIPTSMNADLHLTQDTAQRLNLLSSPLRTAAKLVLAVGAEEPEEFHRQSQALAAAWNILEPTVISLAGANHYTAIDSLAQPGGTLNAMVMSMLEL